MKIMRQFFPYLALCMPIVLVGTPIFASTSATIAGRVTDQQELVVPGAQVQATNILTNINYAGETNEDGLYRIPNLPPGEYRVIVQKDGFASIARPGVELHVQDIITLNFAMQIGSVTQTITVEGGAPLVSTESAAVSTVVDRQFVENMPLNGRSFQTLIQLTPGVVLTPASYGSQGQFSINGQRSNANYFTVDGASANVGIAAALGLTQSAGGSLPAFSVLGGTNSLVSVDAMQEFRIQTSTYAPEFGRTPGGQISIVTRSGTNEFHGGLFDYVRHDVLDSNDWFANRSGLPKPMQRQHDFGGVLGGPLLEDRTFFFYSYEGLRLQQPKSQSSLVPSLASRQAAPAAVQPLLNAFPVPTGPDMANGLATFVASYADPATLDAHSLRLDHTISPSLALFARYSHSSSEASIRGSGGVLSSRSRTLFINDSVTLGLTASLSQNMSNELRANYSSVRSARSDSIDNFGGAIPFPDNLVFPSGFSSANGNFAMILIGAGTSNLGFGQLLTGKTAGNKQRQVNVLDSFAVTAGLHQMKFGIDYRWLSPISGLAPYQGALIFSSVSGAAGSASSGVARLAQIRAFQEVTLLSQNISIFVQDTWKITPRLTASYGLRWDVNPALTGQKSNSDPLTVLGLTDPSTLSLAPEGTPLYETTYGNVAPRVGFAFQARQTQGWELVFRGGFGTFYDLGSGALGQLTFGFPFSATKTLVSAPLPLTPQQAAPPTINHSLPQTGSFFVAEPNLKMPRTYQWNVAAEQSLGASQALSISYVGAVGRDLLRVDTLRNPNPNFQTVFVTRNTASSDYHALQLKFQRRLSRGLQTLASYTFSHSIDVASNDSSGATTPATVANPNVDRGNSDFDVRHSFTAALTYDLPFPSRSRFARAIFAAWSLDSFFTARSALPVDIVAATFFVPGAQFSARPDVVPGMSLYLHGSQFPGGKAFNRAAFATPPSGQQGTLSRNVLRGFGAWQHDLAIRREFHFTEKVRLQFRAEFFNILNHPNFANPTSTLTSPLFGQSTQMLGNSLGTGGTSGGLNPLYQFGGPRSIQLALKLRF